MYYSIFNKPLRQLFKCAHRYAVRKQWLRGKEYVFRANGPENILFTSQLNRVTAGGGVLKERMYDIASLDSGHYFGGGQFQSDGSGTPQAAFAAD
jgi:hypothetical protein